MSRCTSDRIRRGRSAAILLGAMAAAFSLSCANYNAGDSRFPPGAKATPVGPWEEAPFELCDTDGSLYSSSSLVFATAADAAPPSCATDADCDRRAKCSCGRCIPRYCTFSYTCGIDNCVDGHCLTVCNPRFDDGHCTTGQRCAPSVSACRANCVSDADCLPGEACEQTDDGLACVVMKWKDSHAAQGRVPLTVSNGMEPVSPSAWYDESTEKLTLVFGLKTAKDSVQLHRVISSRPPKFWSQWVVVADPGTPFLAGFTTEAAPGVAPDGDHLAVFFRTEGGVRRLNVADAASVDDSVLVIADDEKYLYYNPAPYRTSSGDLALLLEARSRTTSQRVVLQAWSQDETGFLWRVGGQPLATAALLEKHDAEYTGACIDDATCGEGLYCYRPDAPATGLCLVAQCDDACSTAKGACEKACGDGMACYKGRCVCDGDGCPDPLPRPAWLEVSKVGEPSALWDSAAGALRIFISATGRASSAQTSVDPSIGLCTLTTEGEVLPFRANPVFDRTFLVAHYKETEPSIARLGAGYVLFVCADGTIKAARTPIKPLIDF